MNTITKQLAAILAGISKDRRPEMAEHYNRLDELKDSLIAGPGTYLPLGDCDELLDEWNAQLETP